MAEETTITEEESAMATDEGNRSGPGFILGIIVGMFAGAAAATLFAPTSGEQIRQRFTDEASPMSGHQEDGGSAEGAQPGTPVEHVRSILARVRSRVHEAAEEGQQAAQDAQEGGHARYAEFTHQDESQG